MSPCLFPDIFIISTKGWSSTKFAILLQFKDLKEEINNIGARYHHDIFPLVIDMEMQEYRDLERMKRLLMNELYWTSRNISPETYLSIFKNEFKNE